jgi:hypothetical protein
MLTKTRKVFFAILIMAILLACLFPKKAMVLGIMAGGKFVAPEASDILYHYCFGNGDTLIWQPEYIKRSPVILSSIKGMREGEIKRVAFKQSQDWRLSYSINNFYLKRVGNKYYIYEWMVFDHTGKIHTMLNLGIFKIRVPDDIVHAFNCKPFFLQCVYS